MGPPTVATRSGRHEAFMLAVAALALVEFNIPLDSGDVRAMAVAFFASWILCLTSLVERERGGIYRPSAMYLLVFGLFHGGLLLTVALRGSEGLTAYDSSWIYSGYTPEAVHQVVLGMAVFTLAAQLASGKSRAAVPVKDEQATGQRRGLAFLGLVIEFAGLGIFAGAVAAGGGFSLLSGGYAVFLQANESDGALGYGTLCIGVGAICAVVAGGRARVIGWAGFIGYAVVAFLIGTRGAVLFPLLALLVAEARCGRPLRRLWAIVGGLVVLVGIGIVRQTRLTGIALPSVTSILAAPLDAVAEMGFSLRPVVVVLGWHGSGEPFRDGSTLIAVPLRFIETLIGGPGGLPAYDDRLFNVEILRRVGPIGGSPVAEAYHNFGTVGVVLLLAALGVMVGRIERGPNTALGAARVALLVPLLLQIRNSFAPVPAQLALVFVLLGIVLIWSSRPERQRISPRGGDHARTADKGPTHSPL